MVARLQKLVGQMGQPFQLLLVEILAWLTHLVQIHPIYKKIYVWARFWARNQASQRVKTGSTQAGWSGFLVNACLKNHVQPAIWFQTAFWLVGARLETRHIILQNKTPKLSCFINVRPLVYMYIIYLRTSSSP